MIETIGKLDRIGKDMAPDVLNALLIKEPFVLSPPLKDHYEIGQIEDLVNHPHEDSNIHQIIIMKNMIKKIRRLRLISVWQLIYYGSTNKKEII